MATHLTDSWFKCYGQAWGNLCVSECMAHPAKFSRKLIFRIFEHAIEEGWVKSGETCLDPFGGVALGALPAQLNGLHWVGIELEARFCALAQDNIDLWNKRYAEQMPNWGSAIIVQGDSRRLGEVLAEARLCLSSPPYGGNVKSDRTHERRDERRLGTGFTGRGRGCFRGSETYGHTEGNLGNLPDTGFEAALAEQGHTVAPKKPVSPAETPQAAPRANHNVSSPSEARPVLALSSPPFIGSIHEGGHGVDAEKLTGNKAGPNSQALIMDGYGTANGQLAALPEGDHAEACERPVCAISSPPFLAQSGGINVTAKSGPLASASLLKRHSAGNQAAEGYGDSSGQLAALPEGDHAEACERPVCAISSPPFLGSLNDGLRESDREKYAEFARAGRGVGTNYGSTAGQLGQQQGATFWAASRQILEQVYQVLAPGAHAIWVVKAFVRNKAIVDFPGQWRALCESVGFRTLHEHHAILTEDRGSQHTLDGGLDVRQVKRASFFRRLHERKYPHLAINHEVVYCMVKPS